MACCGTACSPRGATASIALRESIRNLTRTYLPAGVPALREPGVRARVPHGRHLQGRQGPRGNRLRQVHRLPHVHGRLPLQRPHVQLERSGARHRCLLRRCPRARARPRRDGEVHACARSAPTRATSPCACAAARPMPASSATWTTRIPPCRACAVIRALRCCWKIRARARRSFTFARRVL